MFDGPRSTHRRSERYKERMRQERRADRIHQGRDSVQSIPEDLPRDELTLADERVQALEKALIAARRRRCDLLDAAALALECERDRSMEA